MQKYSNLYQVTITEASPEVLVYPHGQRLKEYSHLVPIDDGLRAGKALCGYLPGIGHVPGFSGVWADDYVAYRQFVPCPDCESKRRLT